MPPACFVGVVQAGSLSAAATRLGIPLPTLSRRIRDLERQLKVQLLERSARGAKLTDAGSRLYDHASRSIEALLEAEQAVVSDQARLKGRLRLSLPQTVEPWWELLAAFQRRYPDIQVYVYSTERRVDLIEDGIDVALRVGAIVHPRLHTGRLAVTRKTVAGKRIGPELASAARLIEEKKPAEATCQTIAREIEAAFAGSCRVRRDHGRAGPPDGHRRQPRGRMRTGSTSP
jgi:DNA-binding transcriptional LysR family regulator